MSFPVFHRSSLLLLFLLCAIWPIGSTRGQSDEPDHFSVAPREVPRQFKPFDEVETHRIRITNVVDGPVEVSVDKGKTWQMIGRVTAPATQSLMGYLASGYAPVGTVAAVAVHGIRIRVGDLNTAYPKMVNVLPSEFAQTPNFFGGHIAGASGIYTDIHTGTSIFRELSPYSGNPVFLTGPNGYLNDLPTNYQPKIGDVLIITVRRPAIPLVEVDFQNVPNGTVTVKYANGTSKVVTHVLKPVYGVGRYDGTSYTGAGAINTTHTGVMTIGTAPITTSDRLEGTGDERRGGFQIQPSYHNTQSEEAWADSVMVLGDKGREYRPDLEGTPPLFLGYLDLSWLPNDPDHSWRMEVQYGHPTRPAVKTPPRPGASVLPHPLTEQEQIDDAALPSGWQPMPTRIGTDGSALRNVVAMRLIRVSYGGRAWLSARVAQDAAGYRDQRMHLARAGKLPVDRGRVVLDAGKVDPRTKFVAFYVDGELRSLTNSAPYQFVWDTAAEGDGEHVIEICDEDDNNAVITTSDTHVWVDNNDALENSHGSSKNAGGAGKQTSPGESV